MVGPGCGGGQVAHLEDVLDHAVDSRGRVGPQVVEEIQCVDMEDSFNWKLSSKKV